jgi:hypothetical protein
MKKLLKNDAFLFLSIGALVILVVYGLNAAKGRIIVQTVYLTFFDVLDIIVAVSIFIGLFQVWVKPPTIVKWLGKGSGLKGFILVCTFPMLMGGSLFTLFPLLKTLREKGARVGALASFITAWGGRPLSSRWRPSFSDGLLPCSGFPWSFYSLWSWGY